MLVFPVCGLDKSGSSKKSLCCLPAVIRPRDHLGELHCQALLLLSIVLPGPFYSLCSAVFHRHTLSLWAPIYHYHVGVSPRTPDI